VTDLLGLLALFAGPCFLLAGAFSFVVNPPHETPQALAFVGVGVVLVLVAALWLAL